MYRSFKPRLDWFSVSRRLGQSPHLRLVIGIYGGRSALVRPSTGTVLAVTPKAALAVIAELSAAPQVAKAA